MNKEKEIREWIASGRHWHPGLALLNKYSNNSHIKNYFSKCEPTNSNQESLLYELKKLLQNPQPPVIQPAAPVSATDQVPVKINQSEEIEKLDALWKPKFKELAGLRQRLMYYGKDDEGRKKAAFRILDLFDECRNIWRKRDYVIQHGSFPEIPSSTKDLPNDPVKLILKRNNLRTRISKAVKRMCLYEAPKQLERQKDIALWKEEISFIEQRLKELGAI